MIKILIVSYNIPVSEAATFLSLRSIFSEDKNLANSFHIHVWDNSSVDRSNDVADFFGAVGIEYEYTSTPENLYLSKIYNKCAALPVSDEYLMILDHDTHVTGAYLREALRHEIDGYHLILPRVYSTCRLISPAVRYYCKGRLLNSMRPGHADSKNLLAINSGMIINYSVFEKFTYHSDLRFYGTDTWFMVNYERYFTSVMIMESELNHSLHIESMPEKKWLKEYFQEQVRVNKIIFSAGLRLRAFTWFYNLYLKVVHT